MIRDSLERLIRERYDFESRQALVRTEAGWSPDFWQQLAELGLFMAPFSEADGGLGGGAVDAMIVMEELGKGLVVEPYLPSIVCGGGFLKHAGTQVQKENHLSAIMDGSQIFAFAWAEPKGRYNPADLETTARRDGTGYVLNGHKAVVIGAPWASHLIVTARTSGDRRDRSGISAFILDKTHAGVTSRDYPTVDERRASEIYLENVSVPEQALIGEEGKALPLIEQVIDEAIAALCAEACGVIKVANAMTLDYARQRRQFGVPIGSFQVLQHRMVDMFMEHEQAVSMTYMATLKLGEEAAERARAVSAAKVRIGQAGRFVGQQAIQIHGGMGMTDELAIGHYFKRLSMINTEFGDVSHQMKRYMALAA